MTTISFIGVTSVGCSAAPVWDQDTGNEPAKTTEKVEKVSNTKLELVWVASFAAGSLLARTITEDWFH